MWMVSSCKQVIRWWSESLDRRIPWWRKLLVSVHTSRCGPCDRYQKQVLTTRDLHRAATSQQPKTAETAMHHLSPQRKNQIVAAMEQVTKG